MKVEKRKRKRRRVGKKIEFGFIIPPGLSLPLSAASRSSLWIMIGQNEHL